MHVERVIISIDRFVKDSIWRGTAVEWREGREGRGQEDQECVILKPMVSGGQPELQ